MIEVFKPVVGYEDYQVSNFGNVKRFYRNGKEKILKPLLQGRYLFVVPCKDGKPKPFYVHRLVAEAFLPNPDNKPQVNHIDGNKLNNHVDNLEWATSKENHQHAVSTGLEKAQQGEGNYNAKLTADQVRFIRDNPLDLNIYELGKMFGVAYQTISRIQRGGNWKHVGGVIREKKVNQFR